MLYISFLTWQFSYFLAIIPFPIAVFLGILAFWPRKDQPIEVYLAALLRFWLKPRRRIWNQDGVHQSINVTAPKHEEETIVTDNLTQGQVKSRLRVLADTLDSRGWTSKNVEVQDVQTSTQEVTASDRLIMPLDSQPTQPLEIHQSDDILDVANNPVAQNFDAMSQKAAAHIREQAVQGMHAASSSRGPAQRVSFDPYPADMHQHVVKPIGQNADQTEPTKPRAKTPKSPSTTATQKPAQTTPTPPAQPRSTTAKKPAETKNPAAMTQEVSPDILKLANNSDLSVSTLAHQAEQTLHNDEEVSLH